MEDSSKEGDWPRGMRRRTGNANFDRPLAKRSRPHNFESPLPLVHVTRVAWARDIIRADTLVPQPCKVFGKKLLYFFALRPAYRLRRGDEKFRLLNYFPVVFVVKPDAVKYPYHVYPFDTGGGAKGAFAGKADEFISLEEYALDSSHAGILGFVAWAFGDLRSYFEGRLRPTLEDEIAFQESVEESYLEIARMGVEGDPLHDKRASAVELAYAQPVDIRDGVRLIIIPKQLIERPDPTTTKLDELQKIGVTIKHYNWQPNSTPNEFQDEIMRISREWYEAERLWTC